MTPPRLAIALALVAALAGPSGSASAANGVVEINQDKALAGGITPGDEPGFPVTLSEPGRYQLTGDLTVSGEVHAIVVEADGITLDLGGFAVSRPRGGGHGATLIYGPLRSRVTVQNGELGGLPLYCISLGPSARLFDVRSETCLMNGTSLGPWAIVASSTIAGGDGTALGVREGVVSASSISGYTMYGVLAGRSVVVDSEITGGAIGIIDDGGVVRRTSAAGNIYSPFAYVPLGNATVIEDSTLSWFGLSVPTVRASSGSSISGCAIHSEFTGALVLDADSTYRDNTITTDGGVTVTGGIDLGGNVCNGEPACP
jgi:hypothetical protein